MATATPFLPPETSPRDLVPPLQNGDRLARDEFERRYAAMPYPNKAELIEGVVYVSSPVRDDQHGIQHFDLNTWLGLYRAMTPGILGGCESSIRLDWDNEPQPDGLLRILPTHGGIAKSTEDGYLAGAPDFLAEIAASSVSYDLHVKLHAYRRNGVREYVVWRVLDREIDWFFLHEGQYQKIPLDAEGINKSRVFPGLWLDAAAMMRGDMATVMKLVQRGLQSTEHAEFVARLAKTAAEIQAAGQTKGQA